MSGDFVRIGTSFAAGAAVAATLLFPLHLRGSSEHSTSPAAMPPSSVETTASVRPPPGRPESRLDPTVRAVAPRPAPRAAEPAPPAAPAPTSAPRPQVAPAPRITVHPSPPVLVRRRVEHVEVERTLTQPRRPDDRARPPFVPE